MNRKIKWKGVRRATAALLAGLCLLTSTGATAIRADAADGGKKLATAETAATPETAAPADLSERAQAFIDAVNALDRDGMVAASNAWGLAHEAWLADPDNAELEAALNEATAAQEEACAPLSEAEELYNQISEAERSDERVQDAYAALAVILAATYTAMENPTATGPDGTPELDEIRRVLYGDLPDEPTGSYIGSMGLPIATGETRISISEWVTDLYDGVDAHINAAALHADGEVITVDRMAGEDYAIVPIMVQVEYPANGSTTEIILPDSVTLLDYEGNAADAAEAAEAEDILCASYTETSAAAHGIYVQAAQDFTAEFVYTAPDGTELSKSLEVKVSDGGTNPIVTAKSGISTYAAEPTPPFTTGKITSIAFEGGTWLIWFNGIEAYCCSHGLSGQPNGCPTYSFAYVSKLEPGRIPRAATMPTRSISGAGSTSCRSVCWKKSTAVLPLRPMACQTMQQRKPPTGTTTTPSCGLWSTTRTVWPHRPTVLRPRRWQSIATATASPPTAVRTATTPISTRLRLGTPGRQSPL